MIDWHQRVVTQLPLLEIWTDTGPVSAERQRDLGMGQVSELLRAGVQRFVVVDVGAKPRWIKPPELFTFWKREAKPRLAEPDENRSLDDFPGGYFYRASEWIDDKGAKFVAFERNH